MTSRRMGIVIAALVAVWGLAGPMGLPPITEDLHGPGVGIAQAGDPDNYVGSACGESDAPAAQDSTNTGTVDPPNTSNDGGRQTHLVQKGAFYASLILWSMIGSLF